MKLIRGFTLIELMVVIAIIGTLASISLPAYQGYIDRADVTEAVSMAGAMKSHVNRYYEENRDFPADNASAGMPPPDKLLGNRIKRLDLVDGAIHVTLGNKVSTSLDGKVLSFRPAVVEGSPESPIAWLCGNDEPVAGMRAVGDNRTDIEPQHLPGSCR